jgi:hypothetical protein
MDEQQMQFVDPDSTFHLDFSSISGTLNNDFGSNNVGSGQPATLQITTSSGPVYIKKQ